MRRQQERGAPPRRRRCTDPGRPRAQARPWPCRRGTRPTARFRRPLRRLRWPPPRVLPEGLLAGTAALAGPRQGQGLGPEAPRARARAPASASALARATRAHAASALPEASASSRANASRTVACCGRAGDNATQLLQHIIPPAGRNARRLSRRAPSWSSRPRRALALPAGCRRRSLPPSPPVLSPLVACDPLAAQCAPSPIARLPPAAHRPRRAGSTLPLPVLSSAIA